MSIPSAVDLDQLLDTIQSRLDGGDLAAVADAITPASAEQMAALVERLPTRQRAVVYRLLPKERAIDVFERLSPGFQGDLIHGLQDSEVASLFAALDPDARVWPPALRHFGRLVFAAPFPGLSTQGMVTHEPYKSP